MTFSRTIRYRMARDKKALSGILRTFINTLFSYQRRLAKADGYSPVLPGAVAFLQHFGGTLNANLHLHTWLMDGVFVDVKTEKSLLFVELPIPTQKDVEFLTLKIARRVLRFVASYVDSQDDDSCDDFLADALADVPSDNYSSTAHL